jgi:alpha-tubulin suppressor-like RCC1 family protein
MQPGRRGEHFCVALMQNGLVFSWGDGEEGKLGLGRPESQERPTMVDFLMPTEYAEVAKRSDAKDKLMKAGARVIKSRGRNFRITSLCCGARHSLALSSTSEVFSWGSGCCGQLGHGSKHDEMLPRPIMALQAKGVRVQALAAGAYHSSAIILLSKPQKATRLFTWGDGGNGRLGLGDDKSRTLPNEARHHRIAPRSHLAPGADPRGGSLFSFRKTDWLAEDGGFAHEWRHVVCGSRHCAALTASGQVYTWGADEAGQLGHGGYVTQRLPCLLSTLVRPPAADAKSRGFRRARGAVIGDVRTLGCGKRFTAALTWGGEIWMWGRMGNRGMPRPTMVERLRGASVVSLGCGEDHLAVLTGTAEQLRQLVETHGSDAARAAAIEKETAARLVQMKAQMVEDAEAKRKAQALKNSAKIERRRKKLVGRLANQRRRLAGLKKQKAKSDEELQKEAEAKMQREMDEAAG